MRLRKSFWLSPLLVLSCVFILTASIPNVATGTWQTWNPMGDVRSGSAAVLLQDGRVLITGGNNAHGPVASADLFGTDGDFSAAAVMQSPRSGHTATVLSDGRVLVAGGTTSGGGITNSAEIYDPTANSWALLSGTMVDAHSGHTASLLPDGRVLLAGGQNSGGAINSLEIFDPSSGNFSGVGVMTSARMNHAAASLQDGRVLLLGGSDGTNPLASVDVFDPGTGTVSAGPNLSSPRVSASATPTLDGKVAVIGGNNGASSGPADLATADILVADPSTGQLSSSLSASHLLTPRSGHQSFLLPKSNAILVIGGSSSGTDLNSAELYYSWADTFQATGSMSVPRPGFVGSAISHGGMFLAAGGTNLSSTELYGFATVKTDAADYPPGSTVTITGSGWQPGETVTLTLVESPLIDTHGPFTTVADANGNISNSSFVTDTHDENVRFYLTASGSQTQAQNTFTDATSIGTVTVIGAQTPNPVAPGGSATYGTTAPTSVDVRFNGNTNGTACKATLGTAGLPSGATATFAPPTLSSTTPQDLFSLLTINTTSALTPGSYSFTATAVGSGGCGGSSSSANQTLVVVEPTTTTLTSSVNPSTFGQSTTLTATVARTAGPTTPNAGTVTFKDGATTLGTGSLNASGVATLAVSALTAGSHSLTASYAGTALFGASNSNTVVQTVNQASTTTTVALTTGANPSVFGQSLTFTATVAAVAPGAGTPTGTVTFKDSATTIGTGALDGTGKATLTTATLAVGNHSIAATYNADTNFTGSTSSALAQTVNQATTTTTITNAASLSSTSSVVGQAVTINFTVVANAPVTGTPTGTVTVGDGVGDTCSASVATGTCSITFNSTGTKSLTASYPGDANFSSSTSSPATSHTVNAASTTTTITAHTPNPSVVNTPITVNFTVTVNSPGSGTIPGTGTVTASDGTGDTCTGTVTAGTCQLTPTTTGNKTLTALYPGDANFATSASAGVAHTVGQPPTITSANNASFTVNSAGSFTVTASGFPAPTFSETGSLPSGVTFTSGGVLSGTPALGTVGTYPITITASNGVGSNATQNFTLTVGKITPTFSALTASQSIPYGTATISLSGRVNGYDAMPGTVTITINGALLSGIALNGNSNNFGPVTFNTSTIPASATPYTITYTYSGDANSNSASDTSTTLTVNKVTPTVNWSNPAAITYGTPLSSTQLNATFTASFNGGTVTVAGTPTYNPASGTVLNAGVGQTLSVSFVPTNTTDYNNANGSALITVNKADTSTAVVSSLNPSFSGQSVTLTATVTNTSGTSAVPTGSVQFMDGASPLGSPQTLSGGSAAITTSSLSVATHSITAVYTNSDGNFNGGTSGILSQVVNSAATVTTLQSSNNPSTYGNSVSFTATVAPQQNGLPTPTGTVQFKIDGMAFGTPIALSGGIAMSGSTSSTQLTAGAHTIEADYTPAGGSGFLASVGTLTQNVNKANATINVTPYSVTYDGNPHAAMGTATGVASVDLSADLNLSGTTHTSAGTYATDAWGFHDASGNYADANGTVSDLINQAIPAFTWNNPADITYGTPLSGTQLNATASVSGAFTYTPAAGTVLNAAPAQTLSAVFTPADTMDFATVSASVQINVTQATPLIVWNNPADITYGTALGSTQLNAIALPVYSLKGWWKAEGDATAFVGGNDGTLQGGTTFTTGELGQAFSFPDSSGDGVTIPYNSAYDMNAPGFTASFWMQGSQNNTGLETVLEKSHGFIDSTGWAFQVNSSTGSVQFALGNGAGFPEVWSSGNLLDGKFHHVVGTWDGATTMSLYVDGVLQGNATSGTPANNTRPVNIGFTWGGGTPQRYFQGAVDEVQIFGQAVPAGTYAYSPASGTVLNAGNGQPLSVTFTPTDTTDLNPASTSVSINVKQATANISVTPYNVTYDGNAHTATGTAKGVGGIDLSAGLNLTGTTHTNAGTYTDTWTFTDSTGNYNNIASTTVTDTINKATATVVVAPYSVTYDGSPHTATVTSITGVNGETGATVGTVTLNTTHTNAGTYASDSWSFTGAANYNNIASTTITDTINKATATVVVAPYTVTYDGSPHTATVTSITGVNGETGATVGTVTLNTTHTNAGTYASDSWSFTGAANYNNIASTTITDTINKATATVVVAPYTVTYDGSPHTATVTSITGVNGETGATVGTVTLNTTHTNAGTYASDSWSFTGAANYNNIASTTITDTINKATATVVVTPYTVTYDGSPHTATVTSITGVNGETGATVGTVTLNTTHTNAGTYASDSWSFTGAANYNNIASTSITDTINKATATVVVAPYTVTYDGSPHTATVTSITGVNGETGATVGTVTLNTTHTNAGTYASDSWSFTGAANYNNIASTSITDTINKATATVVVTPYTVTYDGSPHTATVTSITGVNGETGATVGTVTLNTTHTNAGTYASDSWSFTGAANYNNIASTTITDTINKATATVVVAPYTVTYDGSPHTATVTSITGVNGETGATVGTVTLNTTHTNAGTYASDSWSFTGAANYNNIASTTITDTINKATPIVTWANPANITYGTALSITQLNANFTWVVSGSMVTVAGTATYSPASGTVLNPGAGQILSVSFAPTDTTDYNAPPTKTVTINVLFASASSGLCDGDLSHTILQPINADGTSVFKMGSTVPTKFRVCDVFGNSVGPTTAFSNVVKRYNIVAISTGTTSVDETVSSTTPDTAFRWDPTAQQWIFNTATGAGTYLNSKGVTYLFNIVLIDGTIIGSSGTGGVIPSVPFAGYNGYQYGLK